MLLPKLRYPGKVQIGVVSNDAVTARLGCSLHLRANDDAASLRAGQLLLVLGMAEKTQVLWLRAFKRSQSFNQSLSIAKELTFQRCNDGAYAQHHPHQPFSELLGSRHVQCLDDFVGHIVLRIHVHGILKNDVVVLCNGNVLDGLVGALDDLL